MDERSEDPTDPGNSEDSGNFEDFEGVRRSAGSDDPRATNGSADSTGADSTDTDDTDERGGSTTTTGGTIDLSAVQADDALLDALGGANPDLSADIEDSELNALLLSWRQQAESTPIPDLVDVETAAAAIAAARAEPARRRRKLFVPIATAAAVLAIAFGGVGLAAKSAQPGDALWGLTQVLYADHARSVVAVAAIRDDFSVARRAIASGHIGNARTALVHAGRSLPSVEKEDGKAGLQATQQALLDSIGVHPPTSSGRIPGTTSPAAPPSVTSSSPPPASSASATSPSSPPPTGSTEPPTSGSPTPSTTSAPASPTTTTETGGLYGKQKTSDDGTGSTTAR